MAPSRVADGLERRGDKTASRDVGGRGGRQEERGAQKEGCAVPLGLVGGFRQSPAQKTAVGVFSRFLEFILADMRVS